MRVSAFAALALAGLLGVRVLGQTPVAPNHDLPNPYQAAARNWGVLPDNRTWGSTAGVEIGPRNEIWAIDRCGVNTCDGANQFGRPSGLYIDKADKLYVIDADSTSVTNPGWKKGIRIGSAKDGKVVEFVPGHQTDTPDGAAGEGIVSDPAGNLYAAENTLRGVTKYAKR
jgi:hypothetical protein